MKKNSVWAIIVLIVVVIVIILLISSGNKQNSINTNSETPISQNNNSQVLFASSSLAQNAYLISTPTYDANTQTALAGFNVVKNPQADGSTQITLNATNPDYQTQTYTVKPGEKLYFIEGNLGDDSGNTDKTMGDDTAVLVDANGYIIGQ